MDYGEVPRPGERPVTPLWEQVPSYNNGAGGGGNSLSGGGSGSSGGGGGTVRFTTREVQAPETVRSQLTSLLAEDGDYIQQARGGAARQASARGLLSSGMAAGNAQAAAIQAGLPIAQQDASWYGRTAADNMDAENRAAIEEANNATARATTSMSVSGSLRQAAMRNELEREQNAYDRNFRREQNIWDSEELDRQDYRRAGIDAGSDYRRAGIDADSDYRREGIDTRSAYRDEGIQGRADVRRYGLDARTENARRRNDSRDYAYRSILDQVIQNPEEWDRDQISGVLDYFAQYGDELYDETFDDIFGGG